MILLSKCWFRQHTWQTESPCRQETWQQQCSVTNYLQYGHRRLFNEFGDRNVWRYGEFNVILPVSIIITLCLPAHWLQKKRCYCYCYCVNTYPRAGVWTRRVWFYMILLQWKHRRVPLCHRFYREKKQSSWCERRAACNNLPTGRNTQKQLWWKVGFEMAFKCIIASES